MKGFCPTTPPRRESSSRTVESRSTRKASATSHGCGLLAPSEERFCEVSRRSSVRRDGTFHGLRHARVYFPPVRAQRVLVVQTNRTRSVGSLVGWLVGSLVGQPARLSEFVKDFTGTKSSRSGSRYAEIPLNSNKSFHPVAECEYGRGNEKGEHEAGKMGRDNAEENGMGADSSEE